MKSFLQKGFGRPKAPLLESSGKIFCNDPQSKAWRNIKMEGYPHFKESKNIFGGQQGVALPILGQNVHPS